MLRVTVCATLLLLMVSLSAAKRLTRAGSKGSMAVDAAVSAPCAGGSSSSIRLYNFPSTWYTYSRADQRSEEERAVEREDPNDVVPIPNSNLCNCFNPPGVKNDDNPVPCAGPLKCQWEFRSAHDLKLEVGAFDGLKAKPVEKARWWDKPYVSASTRPSFIPNVGATSGSMDSSSVPLRLDGTYANYYDLMTSQTLCLRAEVNTSLALYEQSLEGNLALTTAQVNDKNHAEAVWATNEAR
jgi:hypothetical protein